MDLFSASESVTGHQPDMTPRSDVLMVSRKLPEIVNIVTDIKRCITDIEKHLQDRPGSVEDARSIVSASNLVL